MRNWQYLPGVKRQACVLNLSENCCFCSISLDKRSLCSDIVNDKQPSGFIMDGSIMRDTVNLCKAQMSSGISFVGFFFSLFPTT